MGLFGSTLKHLPIRPGLPGGILTYQNPNQGMYMSANFIAIWYILWLFYDYLVYFVVILVYFVVILVYFVVILVYFSCFGML
jgi:hypothetical protein